MKIRNITYLLFAQVMLAKPGHDHHNTAMIRQARPVDMLPDVLGEYPDLSNFSSIVFVCVITWHLPGARSIG